MNNRFPNSNCNEFAGENRLGDGVFTGGLNDNSNASSQFIKKYTSAKKLFGLSFMRCASRVGCAVSSMEFSSDNVIQLIQCDGSKEGLVEITKVGIEYPCTQLAWGKEKSNCSLLAAASDCLRLYHYDECHQSLKEAKCFSTSAKEGPLSALEWNRLSSHILGVTSIDTTVSIWDISKEQRVSHLIGNDKECFDISFGAQENSFITCGGDGAIRQFDRRKKDSCCLLHQSQTAIMKSKWNGLNENFIAFISLDSKDVSIIDRRSSSTIYSSLQYHSANVNNCMWAPKSNSFLMSVSDDNKAVLWDIQNSKGTEAIMEYKADEEVDNCDWNEGDDAYVGITCRNTLQMLLLSK